MIRLVQQIGASLGLGIVRVSGLSMVPALEDGDFVVFRRLTADHGLSPGVMVVVRHQRLGTIIKLLGEEAAPGRFRLHGLSALSMDSHHMGNVARQDIIGRAILRIGDLRTETIGAAGSGIKSAPCWSGCKE